MAGIPESKIAHVEENEKAASLLNPAQVDSVFILYDVYTIGLANRVKEQVKAVLKDSGGENGKEDGGQNED